MFVIMYVFRTILYVFRGITVYFEKCINGYTGFEGTVLGQDYWDTTLEFLV